MDGCGPLTGGIKNACFVTGLKIGYITTYTTYCVPAFTATLRADAFYTCVQRGHSASPPTFGSGFGGSEHNLSSLSLESYYTCAFMYQSSVCLQSNHKKNAHFNAGYRRDPRVTVEVTDRWDT